MQSLEKIIYYFFNKIVNFTYRNKCTESKKKL